MRPALAPLLLAVTLTLAGCGGADSDDASSGASAVASASPSAPAGPHNAADVTFAQQMVPHHQQALEMVKLAGGHELDPEVQSLADGIERSQTEEVATMSGWLKAWSETVPTSMSEPMKGMLSDEQMTRLRDTEDDRTFQASWLLFMVQHHQGAIAMAQSEISDGSNPEAIALAREIVRTQEQELGTMSGMTGP